MTSQQLEQWNQYACMSRCLIKAAQIKGISLSRDLYCVQFEAAFPYPAERYGMLNLSRFLNFAKAIGLGAEADFCHHYSEVKNLFNSGKHLVFIVTGVNLNPNATDPVSHLSILTKIDDNSFELWTPEGSGKDCVLPFVNSDWRGKQSLALILF